MNSFEWVNSLRHINCMEKEDFKECFGPHSGDYLWDKFLQKDQDIFDFLSYLDLSNAETLYQYVLRKMKEQKGQLIANLAGVQNDT